MNIGTLGNSHSTYSSPAIQRQPETSEAKTNAPDRDGDADDGSKTISKAPAPTVNLSGQSVGQLINAVA